MKSHTEAELRKQLVKHVKGRNAFLPIEKVIEKVPFKKIGIVPEGLPYSFYQQVYHIRIAQVDILDYCRDENYKAPNWPDDYWPENPAPADEAEWNDLVQNFFDEREEFCEIILDSTNDLFEPFEANPNHNLLREAELVIEHNAYHIGQLYVIARLLDV